MVLLVSAALESEEGRQVTDHRALARTRTHVLTALSLRCCRTEDGRWSERGGQKCGDLEDQETHQESESGERVRESLCGSVWTINGIIKVFSCCVSLVVNTWTGNSKFIVSNPTKIHLLHANTCIYKNYVLYGYIICDHGPQNQSYGSFLSE